MDGARPTDPDPASVLRACQLQKVTQHPQQRHIRVGFDLMGPAVDLEGVFSHGVAIDVRVCEKVRRDFLGSLILQKKVAWDCFPLSPQSIQGSAKETGGHNHEEILPNRSCRWVCCSVWLRTNRFLTQANVGFI